MKSGPRAVPLSPIDLTRPVARVNNVIWVLGGHITGKAVSATVGL
jgi:hypothetical protein